MKEHVQKPENASRTIQSNSKTSKQAPRSEILQAYKDRIDGKPVQRQSINEEELLQAKATQQDHIKTVLQRYSERNIQQYVPEEDEELIQGKFDTAQREEIDEGEILQGKFESDTQTEQEPLPREEKPNNTGLPDNLKTGIESLSGYSMDDVKVHYNSGNPAQLNALAYAQGTDIHVAPGQEKHLPHEAWHVVQQKQGRVQPTMQLQGVNVNDNEGLEKEADVMGKISLNNKLKQINENSQLINKRLISSALQRVIRLEENDYPFPEVFNTDGVFDKIKELNPLKTMIEIKYLACCKEVYDANNNLCLIPDAIPAKSEREIKLERIQSSSTILNLEQKQGDYPIGKTLFAPINCAILVINDGPIEFVGTGGLIGCVEVMIEYHTEDSKGYLVAHVNSAISTNLDEINRQLTIMIDALGKELRKKIKWSDFTKGRHNKITLVRSAKLGEQELLINIADILAKSGAHMRLVSSTSVSMKITPDGAEYYDNIEHHPKLDYRREKGYPFPEE